MAAVSNHLFPLHDSMAGISRSASVVVAYLVKFEKMPLPEALRHAKEI